LALLYKASANKDCAAHAILYLCTVCCFAFGRWGVSGAGGRATGLCEVARGGCLFACNFSVTRSTVLTEVRKH